MQQFLINCGTCFNSSPRNDGYKQRSHGDRAERDSYTETKEEDDGI